MQKVFLLFLAGKTNMTNPALQDSTMTTKIHNVRRKTSAGSSDELAESHVNKTTRLATEDSESPGGDLDGPIQAVYPTCVMRC
jgi:hypothetical protein